MRAPNAAGESATLRAAVRKFACVAASTKQRSDSRSGSSIIERPTLARDGGERYEASDMTSPETIRRQFASDNFAGICPEAFGALERANLGHAKSYGDDPWTARAADLVIERLVEVAYIIKPCQIVNQRPARRVVIINGIRKRFRKRTANQLNGSRVFSGERLTA